MEDSTSWHRQCYVSEVFMNWNLRWTVGRQLAYNVITSHFLFYPFPLSMTPRTVVHVIMLLNLNVPQNFMFLKSFQIFIITGGTLLYITEFKEANFVICTKLKIKIKKETNVDIWTWTSNQNDGDSQAETQSWAVPCGHQVGNHEPWLLPYLHFQNDGSFQ